MTRVGCVAAAVAFCALIPTANAGASEPALETIASFDASKGQLPESITTDRDGNLFFSLAAEGVIEKRTPAGDLSVYGTLPIAVNTLGVKVGPDGCVYTVSTSLSPTPGAFVWRICTPGVVEQFAALDQTGGPNDLAFDDDGNVYVTDTFLGQVWQVNSQGVARVWLSSPLLAGNPADPALIIHAFGADGIAFDKHKEHLYVDNLDYGRILRVDFNDGEPGAVSVFASDPRLRGCDGIAFDDKGNLFVAVNAQDQLAEIDPDGNITIIAQGGPLDGPSSFVFGATGHDKHTLYVTSSAFLRAFGLQSGTPAPAILTMHVDTKGMRLP